MSSYTSINNGTLINVALPSLVSINLDSNKSLSWPTQLQNGNEIVASIMQVSPTANGFILTMPDSTQTSVGKSIYINNPTAFSFTLNKNDNTLLTLVTPASFIFIYLLDNATSGGVWVGSPFGGGGTAVTSIAAVSHNSNITISPLVPITLAGTFDFDLAGNLLALSQLTPPAGLTALTAQNAFATRTLTGTPGQVNIINGSGAGGDPTFSLDTNITGITSLSVGNFIISGNTISAQNAGGRVSLVPFSGGSVDIINPNVPANSAYSSFVSGSSGGAQNIALRLPIAAPLSGQVMTALSNVSPYPLGWSNVSNVPGAVTQDAVPRFLNVGGGLKNSDVFIDDSNNLSLGAFVSPALVSNSITLGDTQQLQLGVLDGNTISVTGGSIRLQPAATQRVDIGSAAVNQSASLKLYGGEAVIFENIAHDNAVSLLASTATSTYNLYFPPVTGSANTLLYSTDGAGQLGFTQNPITIAGISRAYGKVALDGTLAANSLNITSAIRNGAGSGSYTITLTAAFSNTNYSINVTSFLGNRIINATNAANGSFDINFTDSALAAQDTDFSFSCFGT